jgi:hypothetical protein
VDTHVAPVISPPCGGGGGGGGGGGAGGGGGGGETPSIGTEHSFVPPAMRPPNVSWLQTKLPFICLEKNLSARPKATQMGPATVHVLFSLQMVR